MPNAEFKIRFLRELIRSLEYKITKTVDEVIPEGVLVENDPYASGDSTPYWEGAQWHYISDQWPCPDSPFGLCMYHNIHDRAHDDCVFCHDPEERT